MEENLNKKVDESWKETAEKEKNEEIKDLGNEIPPANFYNFVTSLSIQALMFLGELENPITNKKEKDLGQASYLIDTLSMLKEKTKGNLTTEEQNLIDSALYELKMKFVESSKP